ncbi:MAG: hypothetical protein MJZ34_03195 [Paludibacteraceae bacterium]|nr:hypothetical protein [Paludibacteraceae bacterium]
MKSVDIMFGKYISGSWYHVQLLYVAREDCHADEELFIAGTEAISNIISSIDIDDTCMALLGRLKTDFETATQTLPNEIDEIVKDVNRTTAELEFNGYRFMMICRNDVDSTIPYDTASDHAYMMIKSIINKPLFNINCFELGVCNTFEDPFASNINSMVMEFFANGKFKFGTEEDESMVNLGNFLKEYNILVPRHETTYMDTSKLLHTLESVGYKYVIVVAS